MIKNVFAGIGLIGIGLVGALVWHSEIRPLLFPTFQEREQRRREKETAAYLKALDALNKKDG